MINFIKSLIPSQRKDMTKYSPEMLVMSVDTVIDRRKYPVKHPAVEAPLCDSCAQYGLCFFDLDCEGCFEVLTSYKVTIGQLFAVLRQWTKAVQIQLEMIVDQIFKRGANVNDRDGLTDMTMLHYAAKSGAQGEEELSVRTMAYLLDEGALLEARCKWTDMTPLHYAVYFDVAVAVEFLLDRGADIRASCRELCRGNCLHIAATQLALDSARVLIRGGADRYFLDERGRTPHDCLPHASELPSNMTTIRNNLATLLCPASPPSQAYFNPNLRRPPETGVLSPPIRRSTPGPFPPSNLEISLVHDTVDVSNTPTPVSRTQSNLKNEVNRNLSSPSRISAKVTLQSLGLILGDRVMVKGDEERPGILRYCGPVEFADGVWAGVELDEPQGKNNGIVNGVRYFRCEEQYGVFAPITRVNKADIETFRRPRCGTPKALLGSHVPLIDHGTVDVSGVSAKVDTGLGKPMLNVGDRVLVAGQRRGVIRFVGETQFASGIWYGVELNKAVGKNDGAVGGVRYFQCGAGKGVFAPLSRLHKLSSKSHRHISDNQGLNLKIRDSSSVMTSSQTDATSDTSSPNLTSTQINPFMTSSAISHQSNSPSYFGDSSGRVFLRDGLQVLCNNELGIIRYVGPSHFSDGLWVGVELRHRNGKNDGTIKDKRYFVCAPGHGIMVRPSRITVKGINGNYLIPPELAYLENKNDNFKKSD